MKYLDEFRNPEQCSLLLAEIRQTATRPWSIMEVCGGQTHGLLRYGIDQQLVGRVQLLHGPGCPVCVTPLEAVDYAIELARRPDVELVSFGDMLRVPGSRESLLGVRGSGVCVRSPEPDTGNPESGTPEPGAPASTGVAGDYRLATTRSCEREPERGCGVSCRSSARLKAELETTQSQGANASAWRSPTRKRAATDPSRVRSA